MPNHSPQLQCSEAIAAAVTRILLTLATGTGKTFIAFQIAWNHGSSAVHQGEDVLI